MQRPRRLLLLLLTAHGRGSISRCLECVDERASEGCGITAQPREPDYGGDISAQRLRRIKVDVAHECSVNVTTSVEVS